MQVYYVRSMTTRKAFFRAKNENRPFVPVMFPPGYKGKYASHHRKQSHSEAEPVSSEEESDMDEDDVVEWFSVTLKAKHKSEGEENEQLQKMFDGADGELLGDDLCGTDGVEMLRVSFKSDEARQKAVAAIAKQKKSSKSNATYEVSDYEQRKDTTGAKNGKTSKKPIKHKRDDVFKAPAPLQQNVFNAAAQGPRDFGRDREVD